ncbi:MAG: hypothetical protein DRN66_02405 [Candidatus Nanohalarchaeota archaeon]|nr:MAG: hypothetical protein DRN66_02405 [Candidatus Nanohaloarchaeota archaeon]
MDFFKFAKSTGFCANKQTRQTIKQELQKQIFAQFKKPILIYGPTGVGKTYFAHLLAEELNLELVCINGHNFRTRKSITEAKQTVSQQSLFGLKKLIFFDDADAIPGRLAAKTGEDIKKEKEGKKLAGKRKIKEAKLKSPVKELEELIKSSKYPVVLSAGDAKARPLKSIKKISTKFEFQKPSVEEVSSFLAETCSSAGVECEQKALSYIARICDGDVRCALIEAEVAYFSDGKIAYNEISKDNFRDAVSDIKKHLKIIFMSRSANASMEVLSKSNEELGTFAEWIRENIPYEYKKSEDVKNAYEMLSNADIFLGRIKATYWRYMVYASMLLSAGIAVSKKEKYEFSNSSFRFPSKIATYARMKFHISNDAEITGYVNEHCHMSKKKVKNSMAVYRQLHESGIQ